MPLKIINLTITLLVGSYINLGGLLYIYRMFLDQYRTDVLYFEGMINHIIPDLSPDELISLVVNFSLVAKVNRVLRLKKLWGRNLTFSAYAVQYLLGSFSDKKPLIIGFVAFVQLCNLRLRNRRPSAYFTVEHIQFVEELKSALRETIFDPIIYDRLIELQNERGRNIFQWEVPIYMKRFGWFIFAHYYMYIGRFDSLPFKFLTAG